MAGSGGSGGCAEVEGHGTVWDVLRSALFLFLAWLSGRIVGRAGLPPLVRQRSLALLTLLRAPSVAEPSCLA